MTASLSSEQIRGSLDEGRNVDPTHYVKHYPNCNARTFHFVCKRLCQEDPAGSASSTDLRRFIVDDLADLGLTPVGKFNPEDWFGAAWTNLEDNKQPEIAFKSEYLQILERRKAKPYRYGTRESCLSAVRDLLSEQVQP